ncbi:hypothetical protein GCM10029964_069760 [Kibdelosporangium lantanae]
MVRRSQRAVNATNGTTDTATTIAYPVINSPTAGSVTRNPAASCGSSATGRFSDVTDTKLATLSAANATPVLAPDIV